MIMPIIAPVNLLFDARKLILHYRDLGCRVFDLWPCLILWPLVWPVLLNSGRLVAKWIYRATQGLPWMVRLGEMIFWGFAWNISEWKRIENSTDALISYLRLTNIALSIITVKSYRVLPWFGPFCHTSWEGMIKTLSIESYCLRTSRG